MGILDRLLRRAPADPPEPHPMNEIERLLEDHASGRGELRPVIDALLRSEVYLLRKGAPEDVVEGEPFIPLVIPSTGGFPGVCLFTSPERSPATVRLHPEFRTGMKVTFAWVLEAAPEGLGVVINPGSRLCLEQSPADFERFRAAVRSGQA